MPPEQSGPPPGPPPSEEDGRSPWRWVVIGVLVLLGLVLAALVAVRLLASTGPGRALATNFIEGLDVSGQSFDVTGLQGDLLGETRLERLEVSDSEGVWLVAENVTLDWSPLDLLGRRLTVDAALADRITVRRDPVIEPGEDTNDEGGGLPFRAVDVDLVDIDRIELGEGAFGLPGAQLTAEGYAHYTEDLTDLGLDIEPLSVGSGRADGDRAEVRLEIASNGALEGTARVTSPPGGVIAALAQLEPDQFLSVSLDATGDDAQRYALDGLVQIDGATFADLEVAQTGEGSFTEAPLAFELDLNPRLHPLLEPYAAALRGPVEARGTASLGDALEVSARLSGEGLAADIEASGADGAYTGTADLALSGPVARAAEAGFLVADPLPARIDELRYAGGWSLDLDGAANGGLRAELDGRLALDGIAVEGRSAQSVSGPVRLAYAPPAIEADVDLTASGAKLGLGEGAAQRLTAGRPRIALDARYDLDTSALALAEARIQLDGARIDARGTAQFGDDLQADLSGSATVSGAALGTDLADQVSGDWTLRTAGDGALDFTVDGNAAGLSGLPEPAGGWLGDTARFSASGRYADGTVELPELSVSGEALDVSGSGRFAEGALDADLSGRLSATELPGGVRAAQGLAADVSLSGPLDALGIDADLSAPELEAGGRDLRDVRLDVDTTLRSDAPLEAAFDLRADSDEGAVSATGRAGYGDGAWRVDDLEAAVGALQASGSLSGRGGNLGDIRADLAVRGDVGELIPVPVRSVDGTVRVSGEVIDIDAVLQGVEAGPFQGGDVRVVADGDAERVRYTINADGPLALAGDLFPLEAEAVGTARNVLGDSPSTTVSLVAEAGPLALRTTRPAELALTPEGLRADAQLAALGGTGRVQLTPGQAEAGGPLVAVDLERLNLSQLLELAGQSPREGALSASARFSPAGDGSNRLEGPVFATLTGLRSPDGSPAPLDLRLDGRLSGDVLDVALAPAGVAGLEARVNAQVPVDSSADPLSLSLREAPITFAAEVDGPVGTLAELFLPDGLDVTGAAEVRVRGRLPSGGAPELNGTAVLRGGTVEQDLLGLRLSDVAARLDISPQEIRLAELTASGPGNGRVTGTGALSLSGAPSSVVIEADRLLAVNRDEGFARTSGRVTVERSAELIDVSGRLRIIDGELNFDALPDFGGPPTLNVTFKRGPDGPLDGLGEEEEADAPPTPIRLDLSIEAANAIEVSGSGLDAILSVDATVQGPANDPQLGGTVTVSRGTFDLIGKEFDLVDSAVRLRSDIMRSQLDITARREAGDITAEVRVGGTVEEPDISFGSVPDLPEDEVISRVLFGRSPADLSALEAAQLAAALASLSGAGGGGLDLIGSLEDALGVDTLSFGTDAAGSPSVSTGKYLSEDVYLELRTGASGETGVALEWTPLDNVEVEAETSGAAEAGQSLGIQWRKDFD